MVWYKKLKCLSNVFLMEKRRGEKILKKLGWKTKISLTNGLLQTFNWYLNNKKFFLSVSKKLYDKRLGL